MADSIARSRRLLQWSDAERMIVARALAEALARSAQRWRAGERSDAGIAALTGPGLCAWSAEDASAELRACAWTPLFSEAPARASWTASRDPHDTLLSALFDAPRRSPTLSGEPTIADQLATECWREQLAALRAVLVEAAPEVDAAEEGDGAARWRRWGGAVVVQVPWFGVTWHLAVDGVIAANLVRAGGARRLPPPRRTDGAPVPVLSAVADAGVRLEVRCGGAGIDLGSLVSLRVGDVLQLEHRLDEPVAIVAAGALPDAAPLCRAWLGRADAGLGVELTRSSPSIR